MELSITIVTVLVALVLFVLIPLWIALIEVDFYDRLIDFWNDKIDRR